VILCILRIFLHVPAYVQIRLLTVCHKHAGPEIAGYTACGKMREHTIGGPSSFKAQDRFSSPVSTFQPDSYHLSSFKTRFDAVLSQLSRSRLDLQKLDTNFPASSHEAPSDPLIRLPTSAYSSCFIQRAIFQDVTKQYHEQLVH